MTEPVDGFTRALIRVLMIDDERFNHIVVKKILRHENMILTNCTRSIDGLTLLRRETFDVVLLDIVMPELNGVEVLRKIREIHPSLPVIFISALVDDIDNTLLNLVADDIYAHYINKNKIQTNLIKRIYVATDMRQRAVEQQNMQKELQNDAKLAGQIQRLMLPPWIDYSDSSMISAMYRPCEHASGDFYDFKCLPDNRALFVIGDISGHGMQAALYTSSMLSLLKTDFFVQRGYEPHVILNLMNEYFTKINSSGSYLTAQVALFDFNANTMTYQTAGHPDFIHVRRLASGLTECCRYPENGGAIPVGLDRDYVYSVEDTHVISFDEREPIFFMTDGLLDQEQINGTTPTMEEFEELIESYDDNALAAMLPFYLLKNLREMGFTVVRDDLTLVMIVRRCHNPHVFCCSCENAIAPITELAAQVNTWLKDHGASFTLAAHGELLLLEFLQNEVMHNAQLHNDLNQMKSFVRMELSDDCKTLNVRIIDRSRWMTFDENFSAARESLNHPGDDLLLEDRGRGLKIILQITETIRRTTFDEANLTEFILKDNPVTL